MAMVALQIVLGELASLMTEEAQLLGGLRGGVDKLRDDLESMKSFLRDAEARSESDHGVKTWVKQVREVACDTEDVLEEFLFRLSSSPRQRGFIHSLHNFYRYIHQLKARHRLAVQIQNIEERVKAISERRKAFSFNKVDEGTSSDANLWTRHDPRLAALYLDEADIVGIEKPKSLLIKWLVEGEQKLTAISVVGMGGLGKTTLVKKVFDSQPVKRCFDCHAWITVSNSFTPVELLRAALKGFLEATKEPAREGIDTMVHFQLVDVLRSHLEQKRYVIVFDDVWSINAWEALKFALPDYNCSSRIIFTTRSSDVAASIETTGHVYHLQPLSDKEAQALFCMKTFREHNGVCPEELEEMSQNILKKCGGLPLAIVAIGGLLSRKKKMVLEWKKVHDSLAAEMKNDCSLESLGRILLLSYNDLPYYLKSCYLYLSVFPEDYLIKRMKLIRLWVAERFVEEKDGLTMEEVAEEYLNELVSRSMIQAVEVNDFGSVRSYRVHDLMREIIQSKSSDESLVTAVNKKSMTLNEKVRRMAIHENCNNFSTDMKIPGLRSLLVFKWEHPSISFHHAFFNGYRLLRVLDLELAPLSLFPPELVELIHLRYLSLRRTMIRELPESISKLMNLEILDLKSTPVSALPVGISKLERLRLLQGYRYIFETSIFFADTHGMRVPKGIGRLTSLQKLGCVEANQDTLRELGKLNQLKRLGIVKLRRDNGMDLCFSLEKMKHLTSVYAVSINNREILQLDSLSSPPQFLQRLYLKCSLETLPGWIASLRYLAKLVLQDSHLNIDPLKALQELPNLVVLELRGAFDGEELCCDSTGYPNLKKLGIYQLDRLMQVTVAEGAMTGLKALDICSSKELQVLPLGIEHLKNLQELLLWDMPYGFLKRLDRAQNEDFWKVQHIQTIKYVYASGGRWTVENFSSFKRSGCIQHQRLPSTGFLV